MKANRIRASVAASAGATALFMLGMTDIAAATPGFYMTGTYGQSSAHLEETSRIRMTSLMVQAWSDRYNVMMWSGTALDRSDQGYELALGYQITPYLALEGAYTDLGVVSYQVPMQVGTGLDDLSDAVASVRARRRGPALSVVGSLPLPGPFSVDARAGAFFGRSIAKVEYGLEGDTPAQTESSRRGTRAFIGGGVSLSVSPRTAIRIGYTRFRKDALFRHETGSLSLGVRAEF